MARLLAIGELAKQTGVAATALRYYDELGLVRPATRESGRRRYAESAVVEVGVVLFLRDVGFSLAEVAKLVRSAQVSTSGWERLVDRKLAELGEQEHRLRVAYCARARTSVPRRPSVSLPTLLVDHRSFALGVSLEGSHAAAHT